MNITEASGVGEKCLVNDGTLALLIPPNNA
jgi:hypothetical protein